MRRQTQSNFEVWLHRTENNHYHNIDRLLTKLSTQFTGKETKYNKEIGEDGTTKDPSAPLINPHHREATSKEASTKIRTILCNCLHPTDHIRPTEQKQTPSHGQRRRRYENYLPSMSNREPPTTNKRVNRPAPGIQILDSSLFLAAARMVKAWRGYLITLHATQTRRSPILNGQHPQHLRELTLGLATAGTASGRPGEVSNGNDEEAVAVIGQTSESVVPSGERSQEAEETTSLDDGGSGGAISANQVANTQQQEGDVQEEEQQEEGNGRAEGAEQQDGGEDEPAHQEQTHRVIEEVGTTILLERRHNFEAARSQDNSEGNPETTVRGQSSGTKGVSDSHFPGAKRVSSARAIYDMILSNWTRAQLHRVATNLPHTSQQLDETTITESETDDNVGSSKTTSAHVDGTQDESGEGESAQAERSRVGELAVLDRLVQTGLELTTEGTEASVLGIDLGQGPISEASSGASNFVLLGRHLQVDGSSIVSSDGRGADVLL